MKRKIEASERQWRESSSDNTRVPTENASKRKLRVRSRKGPAGGVGTGGASEQQSSLARKMVALKAESISLLMSV